MLNLFDATAGFQGAAKGRAAECPPARNASTAERNNYLRWLASRDGIALPSDAEFQDAGIWSKFAGEYVVPMPGYGQSQIVTCEILDDAGEVVRAFPLPADKRGKLPMTAKQVQDWTRLAPVKAKRGKAAPVAPTAVVAAPTADASDPIAEIETRLADLERAVRALSVESAAEPAPTVAKRTPAHERMVRRAWAERKAMRVAKAHARLGQAQYDALKAERDALVASHDEWEALQHRTWTEAMGYKIKRRRAVERARRMIAAARADAKLQRQNAAGAKYELAKLRRDMADPIQPERASDIARLVQERDQARAANAALQGRAERSERAVQDMADKWESMVSRVSRAEAAVRGMLAA